MARNIVSRVVLLAGLLSGAPLSACKPAGPAQPPQLPPAEVTVSRPLLEEVTDAAEYTGRTDAIASTDVRPRVTGFIAQLHFQPRDFVQQGDVLFTIDPSEYRAARDSAQAQVTAQEANLKKAEFDAQRLTTLYQSRTAAEQEYAYALLNRDASEAAVGAAKASLAEAQLRLDWCTVRAPITGRIGRELYVQGDLVTANQTVLARVVDDRQVYVYMNVSERDALTIAQQRRTLQATTTATIPTLRELHWPVYLGLMTEPHYPHVGVLDYSAPELDASTGTLEVRATFLNADGLISRGMFARIRIPLGLPKTALLVPERALGSDQGQRYLLTVNDNSIVELRPVQVGTLHVDRRVITAGLRPEDWVIVNGIQRVRPGVTVKPIQAPLPVAPLASQPAGTGVAAARIPAAPRAVQP